MLHWLGSSSLHLTIVLHPPLIDRSPCPFQVNPAKCSGVGMVICLSYPARQRGDLDTEALRACDQGVFGEEGAGAMFTM